MFQYNYARLYQAGVVSKPFLGGFQPPRTILTIRASAASSKSF